MAEPLDGEKLARRRGEPLFLDGLSRFGQPERRGRRAVRPFRGELPKLRLSGRAVGEGADDFRAGHGVRLELAVGLRAVPFHDLRDTGRRKHAGPRGQSGHLREDAVWHANGRIGEPRQHVVQRSQRPWDVVRLLERPRFPQQQQGGAGHRLVLQGEGLAENSCRLGPLAVPFEVGGEVAIRLGQQLFCFDRRLLAGDVQHSRLLERRHGLRPLAKAREQDAEVDVMPRLARLAGDALVKDRAPVVTGEHAERIIACDQQPAVERHQVARADAGPPPLRPPDRLGQAAGGADLDHRDAAFDGDHHAVARHEAAADRKGVEQDRPPEQGAGPRIKAQNGRA